MTEILNAALLMAGLGITFGAILAVCDRFLAVPVDERAEAVRALLPGANCGGCGRPGCAALAAAIAKGEAGVDACTAVGSDCYAAIASVLGVDAPEPQKRRVAMVICQGSDGHCKKLFEYEGMKDCRAATLASGGGRGCAHACLGYGTCVETCRFNAIQIRDGIAVIDAEKCTACGMCAAACPKRVIVLERYDLPILLRCRSALKGRAVRDTCDRGCITCGKCARSCSFGAITMANNLPVFDPDICVGCGQCARDCPTGAIRDLNPHDDFVAETMSEAAVD